MKPGEDPEELATSSAPKESESLKAPEPCGTACSTTTSNDEFPPGIYDIIPEDQLHSRTLDGWAIVKVLRVRATSDCLNPPSSYYNNQGQQQFVQSHNIQSNEHFRFLLRKSVESVVKRLQTDLSDLRAELRTVSQQNTAITKDRDTSAEWLTRVTKDLEATATARTKAVQDLEGQQRAVAQMKDALGKIWIQIGEARMKEILGPEATNPQPAPEKARLTAYERIAMSEEEEVK